MARKIIYIYLYGAIVLFALLYGIDYFHLLLERNKDGFKNESSDGSMFLQSTAFQNEEIIPDLYSCTGRNINPSLTVKNIPKNAKTIVLVMDDPDSPSGSWIHWLLWNIPPNTSEIREDSIPDQAQQGFNSYNNQRYDGPCPSSGTHRYFFTVYALDTAIYPPGEVGIHQLEEAMNGHILSRAQLVGRYVR